MAESYEPELLQSLPEFSLLIFSWTRFWFVTVVPKYFSFAIFTKVKKVRLQRSVKAICSVSKSRLVDS
jgi:hypothetical protein